eukprot:870260-Amorphochlora_amoeboformis.AAC.1
MERDTTIHFRFLISKVKPSKRINSSLHTLLQRNDWLSKYQKQVTWLKPWLLCATNVDEIP